MNKKIPGLIFFLAGLLICLRFSLAYVSDRAFALFSARTGELSIRVEGPARGKRPALYDRPVDLSFRVTNSGNLPARVCARLCIRSDQPLLEGYAFQELSLPPLRLFSGIERSYEPVFDPASAAFLESSQLPPLTGEADRDPAPYKEGLIFTFEGELCAPGEGDSSLFVPLTLYLNAYPALANWPELCEEALFEISLSVTACQKGASLPEEPLFTG